MGQFPKNEGDIYELAMQMSSGLVTYAADFPNLDPLALTGAIAAYQANKVSQDNAKSQLHTTTAVKDEKLDALVELLKNNVKLAEVDTTGDPSKLYEIGLSPRSEPTPLQAPGEAMDLRPVAEGQGTCNLDWKKPVNGGQVASYIIQRRDADAQSGQFGPWELVTTTYNTEVNLTDQPRGIQMEYRIIASNTAGQGTPSNVVDVVL